MNGRDFKEFVYQSVGVNARVLFLDRDGHYHEIASAKRFRSKDTYGEVDVLMEDGVMMQSFGELRLERPPQELLDYMNKKWAEEDNQLLP